MLAVLLEEERRNRWPRRGEPVMTEAETEPAAGHQGMPGIPRQPPDARTEQGRVLPCRFRRERGRPGTLTPDFRAPEL